MLGKFFLHASSINALEACAHLVESSMQEAQKQKKEDQQREQQQSTAKAASTADVLQNTNKTAAIKKDQDPDPLGKELASVADPLDEAVKLVRMLKEHAGDRLQTHKWAFQVCLTDKAWLSSIAYMPMQPTAWCPCSPLQSCLAANLQA